MAGIDESKIFTPLRIAILTVSDTRTLETDSSGEILVDRLESRGHVLAARALVKDDIEAVQAQIIGWRDDPTIDVMISTGGTGLTGRDITVEAVTPLIDKFIDGFSVIFHQISFGTVGLSTLQSRAMAGLMGATLIFCLPGSNGAVKDGWDNILKYQLDSRYAPCNMVELMPRMTER